MKLLRLSSFYQFDFNEEYKCYFISEGLLYPIKYIGIDQSNPSTRFINFWYSEEKEAINWGEVKSKLEDLTEYKELYVIAGNSPENLGIYYFVRSVKSDESHEIILFDCIRDAK